MSYSPATRKKDTRAEKCTHFFDPSDFFSLFLLIPLVTFATLVNLADVALIVAFMLEPRFMVDAGGFVVGDVDGAIPDATLSGRGVKTDSARFAEDGVALTCTSSGLWKSSIRSCDMGYDWGWPPCQSLATRAGLRQA